MGNSGAVFDGPKELCTALLLKENSCIIERDQCLSVALGGDTVLDGSGNKVFHVARLFCLFA